MNYVESGDYCDDCGRRVVCRRRAPNHVLHAILSLFLCGLWLPVWAILAVACGFGSWRCGQCGSRV